MIVHGRFLMVHAWFMDDVLLFMDGLWIVGLGLLMGPSSSMEKENL